MPYVNWKDNFLANITSSYGYVAARMVIGLLLFRVMFSTLEDVQFGFWALLWSFLGYTALLDFGLGTTVEKIIAQKFGNDDIPACNRALSTVFWLFICFSFVIFAVCILVRVPLFSALEVSAEYKKQFSEAYWWFISGMGLMLPLALFTGVLNGLQRFYITNWLRTGGLLINAAGILLVIYLKQPFPVIVAVAITSTVLPSLMAAVVSFRLFPALSLHPKFFDLSLIKEQISFSTTSYLSRIGSMLLMKGDRFIVGILISLGAVASYEASAKIALMLTMFAGQLGKQAAPAAAHLHGKNDRQGLRELLLKTSRMVFILVTPCYLVAALFLDPLLRLFTGLEQIPQEIFWSAHSLLLCVYLNKLATGAGHPVLLMSGHEKNVLVQVLLKLSGNIILSIILVRTLGIAGVALGTLISTVTVVLLMQIPMSLKLSSTSVVSFIRYHLVDLKIPLTVMILTTIIVVFVIPLPETYNALDVGLRGLLVVIPVGLSSWKTIKKSLHT